MAVVVVGAKGRCWAPFYRRAKAVGVRRDAAEAGDRVNGGGADLVLCGRQRTASW